MTKHELMTEMDKVKAGIKEERNKLKSLTKQFNEILLKENVLKKIKRLNDTEKAELAQILSAGNIPSDTKVHDLK